MIRVNPTEEELNSEFPVAPMERSEAEGHMRDHRDKLLQGSDWVSALATEKGTTYPTEWAIYRQALRDVPSQAEFPYTIVWPTEV